MSANPEDEAVASSSDTRGLLPKEDDGGNSTRNRTGGLRARSSIEVGSDDEDRDGGEAGGAGVHPFQATPGYRDAVHWQTNLIISLAIFG